MTKYKIKLYSKDKKSLHYFLRFLKYSTKTQNFQLPFNFLRKKKTKKKITVLKSPHVNKTAQEQFQYTTHSVEVSCYSWEIKKYLVLLKKIKNQLFPDIKIKIDGSFPKTEKSIEELLFDPTNIRFYIRRLCSPKQTVRSESLTLKTRIRNRSLLEKNLLYFDVLGCYGNFKQR